MVTEVANVLGVSTESVTSWELNHRIPAFHHLPKIFKFLGYCLIDYIPKPKTFGEKIVFHRKMLGISQKEFAQRLGIDPTTLGHWERDEKKPTNEVLVKFNNSFNLLIY